MQTHGTVVDDCPKHLSNGKSTHSIITEDGSLTIPLNSHGIMSYFNVRTSSTKELEECHTVNLTSEFVEWEPYSPTFEEEERVYNCNNEYGVLKQIASINEEYNEIMDTLLRKNSIKSTVTARKNLFVNEETLAKRWAVGIKIAHETIKATSQNFVRNAVHPIERRFQTKNTHLRYNHLKCRFYSDKFFSGVKSVNGNTCSQLFVTDFGYCKFTPMKNKADANLALQELIRDVGIPEHVHTDGAKEMTEGAWKRIYGEAGIKMSQTEKGLPWQNRKEDEIREINWHARRLMDRTKSTHNCGTFV
jgi:hypothetical protein